MYVEECSTIITVIFLQGLYIRHRVCVTKYAQIRSRLRPRVDKFLQQSSTAKPYAQSPPALGI
jgi:hypothetical protein